MIPKTLPEGWKVVKLGEICKIESGNTAPQGEKYFKNGRYPFIRMQHLNDLEENKYVKNFDLINEIAVKEKKMKLFKKDSILLAKSGESIRTEKKAMLKFESYVVNHLAVLQVINEKTVDKKYLYYFFKKFKLSSLLAKTTTPSINLFTLKTLDVLLPPLPEQKAIAQILSTIDKAIQKVNEIIAKTERLKKGLMQRLLTKGIGHKEFKYSKELGCEIPKEWGVVRLRDKNIVEITMGQSPPSSTYNDEGNGMPFLQGKAEFREIYPIPKKYTTQPLKVAEKRNILISVRAPVGDVNLAPCKICIGRGLAAIKFKKGTNIFYFYWFQKIKSQIENIGKGSTFEAITKNDLENFYVPFPPPPEQQKIAEILSTIDKKLKLERRRKEKFERIKKSLMEVLLSGKVRA